MSVRVRLCRCEPTRWLVGSESDPLSYRQRSWLELTAILSPAFPDTIPGLFAEPLLSDDGKDLEWWSSLPGQPVLLSSLTLPEQNRVRDLLFQRLGLVRQLGERYRLSGNVAFADLIEKVTVTPGSDQVLVQNGQPVIVGWGYAGSGLNLPVFYNTGSVASGHRWWLWLLAILLLLLLISLFLYRCNGLLPSTGEEVEQAPVAEEDHNALIADILDAEREVMRRLAECRVPDQNAMLDLPAPASTIPSPGYLNPVEEVVKPPAPAVKPPVLPSRTDDTPKERANKNTRPASCPPKPKAWENPEVAVLLDASGSMGLSADLKPSQVQMLMRQVMGGNSFALSKLQGGRSRLDAAKDAVADLTKTLPRHIDLGLLVFGRCEGTDNYKFFKADERTRLLEQLRSITPRQGTPLARGLERAGTMLDGVRVPGTIVVVTDGEDSCGGDPCAVARDLKARKPNIRINVISVDGSGDGRCMAETTGGKLILPKDGQSWDDLFRAASGHTPVPQGCE
ncbi:MULTISPECIES: VWA domain-containing protein [unclassified Haematospirillum]|uniref:VWA domain-containing protein n=1 Tax=unclassified Haematospirillum TaxID=2622088 RepID=UPI001439449D|nr:MULTISPECIES: VWA domain-containing protein [unclassified Haematospirillum]NKD55031.1 VWA domain-containing protein [Haematospirillum sp. H4890]NKD76073.1 VWA domain-containing protein [Haematospirillum sp. H4485]